MRRLRAKTTCSTSATDETVSSRQVSISSSTHATDRPSPSRFVDLESKLNNILGLLSQQNEPTNVEIPELPSSGLSTNVAYVEDGQRSGQYTKDGLGYPEYQTDSDLIEKGRFCPHGGISEPDQKRGWETFAGTYNSWITDLGLNLAVLQHLLDRFRKMSSYFPFVLLPDGSTVSSMAEDRPFLLLAAVTSASSKYPHLQNSLAEEFKETLSSRVIMAGERDLDLLQGLLVHLAW